MPVPVPVDLPDQATTRPGRQTIERPWPPSAASRRPVARTIATTATATATATIEISAEGVAAAAGVGVVRAAAAGEEARAEAKEEGGAEAIQRDRGCRRCSWPSTS